MRGEHPKVIQTVMRHSTITLTMDTYGHLFPGQEADAATGMAKLIYGPLPGSEEDAVAATGTDPRFCRCLGTKNREMGRTKAQRMRSAQNAQTCESMRPRTTRRAPLRRNKKPTTHYGLRA